jgi:hypothetical protein
MALASVMLMVCATQEHRIFYKRTKANAELHLVAAELNHKLGIDGTAHQGGVQPLGASKVIVDIHPETTKWRCRWCVVEDQISETCVKSAQRAQLFNNGVGHGVFEMLVYDLLPEDVRLDEYVEFVVGKVAMCMDQAAVKPLLVDVEHVRVIFCERNGAFLSFFPLAAKGQTHELRARFDQVFVDREPLRRICAYDEDDYTAFQPAM